MTPRGQATGRLPVFPIAADVECGFPQFGGNWRERWSERIGGNTLGNAFEGTGRIGGNSWRERFGGNGWGERFGGNALEGMRSLASDSSPLLITVTQAVFTFQTAMPAIRTQQQRSASEVQRRKELAALTRIRDPLDQALAHVAHPRYKDFAGDLYIVCRIVRVFDVNLQIFVDGLEIKAGFTKNAKRRQFDYRDICRGVEFIWFCMYRSDSVKLLERVVHLTLRALGATIATHPCPGCGVHHREFYSYPGAGGIEGLCGIIEFWLRALGQSVESSSQGTQLLHHPSSNPSNLNTMRLDLVGKKVKAKTIASNP
ncbi:hypothetical protein B0H12DRAFT_1072053 [Mycena haematopus]|nr:hypothetical protein B0H12DRAFT_1072053 [Mycena haematopus]